MVLNILSIIIFKLGLVYISLINDYKFLFYSIQVYKVNYLSYLQSLIELYIPVNISINIFELL